MSTFRRPIDSTESLRSTRRSLGDGTVAGRSRLAMPPANRARGTGFQRLTIPPAVGGISTGETITVAATSVAISTTPTLVSFTEEVGERAGFQWSPGSPNIKPMFLEAYYDIHVAIDRGGYGGTVEVEVLRGGEVVWGPTFDPNWSDLTWPASAKGRLVDAVLSPWQVRITGSSGGTLPRVTVQAELVDRPRIVLPPPPFEPPVSVLTSYVDGAGSGPFYLSVTAPQMGGAGTLEVGDWIFGTLLHNTLEVGGGAGTTVLDTQGWTYYEQFPDPENLSTISQVHMFAKQADAADVLKTRTYTWGMETGVWYGGVLLTGFPNSADWEIKATVLNYFQGDTPGLSITPPAGDFCIPVWGHRKLTGSALTPNPILTALAPIDTLASPASGSAVRGKHNSGVAPAGTLLSAEASGQSSRSVYFLGAFVIGSS